MKLGEMTLNEVGKKLTVPLVFLVVAAIMTPPDVISQLVLFFEMAIIYGVLRFIVSRFKSYAQTPQDIKKLIIVFMCVLSITITSSMHFFRCYCSSKNRQLETEHYKSSVFPQKAQTQTQ